MSIDLAVFYLARHAEGLDSFRRFLDSYKRHPAGCSHKLVIIYKGFEHEPDLAAARAEFELPHCEVRVTDEHYDIGAYVQAAHQIDAKHVCFINTHTEILSDNWLAHLRHAIDDESVGVAGASASYESLYDSLALTGKAVWLAGNQGITYEQKLADYFGFVLRKQAAVWMEAKPSIARKHGQFYEVYLSEKWDAFWRSTLKPGGPYHFLADFTRFPNPHIRSNGFIIRREDFLRFKVRPDKQSAYAFESGPNGLSITLLREGKRLIMVDRNGSCMEKEEWPHSHCFRSGNQENLMMADNQTRSFDGLSQPEKDTHLLMSWGDSVTVASGGYPLGMTFKVNRAKPLAKHETNVMPHIADHSEYGVPLTNNYVGVAGGSLYYIPDGSVWPHDRII
jgi:hypothetical protein